MASKINTDNPKHHKYVDTNKYERKKDNKSINFSFIYKIYDVTVLIRSIIKSMGWYKTSYVYSKTYRSPNYHSSYHFNSDINSIRDRVTKGSLVIWNDCNHRTFRIKKKNDFVRNRYNNNKPTIFRFK